MAVLPRYPKADDARRQPITKLNALLKTTFAGVEGVTFLDLRNKFLQPDGSLPADVMPDGTHPNEKGYDLWADALIAAMK